MKTLFALLLLAAPAATLAADPDSCPCSADAEIDRVRHEIAAARLDKLLDLSPEQARALVPLIREAQQLKEKVRAEHDRRRPAITKALIQVRDDIRRDGVASEASAKALKEARAGLGTDKTRERMRELRDRVASILTPEQKQRLRQFDPRPLAGLGRDGSAREGSDELGSGRSRRHKRMGGKKGKRGPLMVVLSPEFLVLAESRAR
ncbi:MAG: Spy/CpxP family protein refolding chaperone [Myxococcales bacterium]